MRLLALVLIALAAYGQRPRLLLTAQRQKRLERDRERQTERWLNFERRVRTVPDSPERGFELALYYVVTKDEQTGKDAMAWAVAHPCQRRQAALVISWIPPVPDDMVKQIATHACPPEGTPLEQMRDELFLAIAAGKEPPASRPLDLKGVPSGPDLYALAEFLDGYRSTQFTDLRRANLTFYSTLPAAYLLSLHPRELIHPTWQQHAAALALVGLDPNLESSQFLQGWALEQRYMLRDGPGVAYEFFWANEYLPGIGYQNMNSWLYRPDEGGTLLARTDWQEDACWIKISHAGVEQDQCPEGWQATARAFGDLDLIPLARECVKVEATGKARTQMLRVSEPHTDVRYPEGDDHRTAQTDDAGLWLVPNDVSGNICQEIKETTHARRH